MPQQRFTGIVFGCADCCCSIASGHSTQHPASRNENILTPSPLRSRTSPPGSCVHLLLPVIICVTGCYPLVGDMYEKDGDTPLFCAYIAAIREQLADPAVDQEGSPAHTRVLQLVMAMRRLAAHVRS